VIDRKALAGSVNLVETDGRALSREEAGRVLAERPLHPRLRPHAHLPSDTRLWAALQQVGGGTWGGCVYDVDAIINALVAGRRAESN